MLRWRGRAQVSLDVSGQTRRDCSDRKWVRSHQRLGDGSRARIRLDVPAASESQQGAEGVATVWFAFRCVINERRRFVHGFRKTPASWRKDSIISACCRLRPDEAGKHTTNINRYLMNS